jgi:hypothetical protein
VPCRMVIRSNLQSMHLRGCLPSVVSPAALPLCRTYIPRRRLPLTPHAVDTRAGPFGRFAPRLGNISDMANVDSSFDIDEMNARDVADVSYVSRRRLEIAGFDVNAVDEDGLPLVYNETRIAEYWKTRPGELAARWTRFAGIALPWLTSLANAFLRGTLERDQRVIARKAVDNLEKLGPTFIKLGQILSIRPDVLPPPIMEELGKLQARPSAGLARFAMIFIMRGAPAPSTGLHLPLLHFCAALWSQDCCAGRPV